MLIGLSSGAKFIYFHYTQPLLYSLILSTKKLLTWNKKCRQSVISGHCTNEVVVLLSLLTVKTTFFGLLSGLWELSSQRSTGLELATN